MTAQAQILAARANRQAPPDLSFEHLLDIYYDLDRPKRTSFHVLHYIHYHGIVATQDYINHAFHRGVRKYYVDFKRGFEGAVDGFIPTIEGNLTVTPLVAEFPIMEGDEEIGHALCLTGYGNRIEEDEQEWGYGSS
ncbi:unnamed protein product [Cuscuta europaea]|uniref:Uncharacterized protein n=1 Tax=Cuscuta europaea TaxID=41803 RepID=A0A9P0YZ17_CUSEU|nr:unnamed protein product [Cuscuta europaea]